MACNAMSLIMRTAPIPAHSNTLRLPPSIRNVNLINIVDKNVSK